jgi:lipopolysaccharide transport system ATP-binding protein
VTLMHTDAKPLIRLEHVGLAYSVRRGFRRKREVWALKDITFDLYRGESLGVIGANGMGKTTLLKVLAGIISPDRGTIEASGCQTALLSLALGFAPNLTGRENILLSGMMLGLCRRVIEARMEDIIAFSELGESIDRPVSTYSSGMRLRLGFAVAIEAEGDVLLIDEALGVGDKSFKAKSRQVLHEMIQSERTVVIVSHSVDTVRALCTRVVWIHEGESVCAGDTETVLARFEEESERMKAHR